jgi:hypothetical protein
MKTYASQDEVVQSTVTALFLKKFRRRTLPEVFLLEEFILNVYQISKEVGLNTLLQSHACRRMPNNKHFFGQFIIGQPMMFVFCSVMSYRLMSRYQLFVKTYYTCKSTRCFNPEDQHRYITAVRSSSLVWSVISLPYFAVASFKL